MKKKIGGVDVAQAGMRASGVLAGGAIGALANGPLNTFYDQMRLSQNVEVGVRALISAGAVIVAMKFGAKTKLPVDALAAAFAGKVFGDGVEELLEAGAEDSDDLTPAAGIPYFVANGSFDQPSLPQESMSGISADVLSAMSTADPYAVAYA